MSEDTRERDEFLRIRAKQGALELRSPCPAGCRFCFEKYLNQLLPPLRLAQTPPLSRRDFDLYCSLLSASPNSVTPCSPIYVQDATVCYSSMSDIFCQGLDREQLDRLLQHGDPCREVNLSSSGNHVDPEMVEWLSGRHPDSLRLHLSVMTFCPTLRATLFTRPAAPQTIQKLISNLRSPKIYLCHFDAAQTIEDLKAIDACAHPISPPSVIVARMHATRLHPQDIREWAARSGEGMNDVIAWLTQHRASLGRIKELFIHAPAEAYAWTFRHQLRERISTLNLGAGDLVLCSVAAEAVMRSQVVPADAHVVAVRDSLGGTTTLTTTLCTSNVIAAVREALDAGTLVRRLVVPSSIWWIEDRYALDGRTADDVRAAFPSLEIQVVDIPMEMRQARLTIEQCAEYFAAFPSAL